MDLRSGCPYWTRAAGDRPPHAPALDRDLTTDVAVLGAGVTGALCAHYLTAAGVDCAALDRRDVARGSTAASTGLLQYEIDKPLVELRDCVGEHAATRAYQLGKDTLDEFARLAREDLPDDCGLATTRSVLLASDDRFVPLLRAECGARRAAGLRVDFLDRAELGQQFQIDRPAALLSHDAARVDPVRLTTALLARATARGLRAFGHTQIDRYASDDTGVTLTTSAGHKIRAKHALFATGYETPEFLQDIEVRLKSTYACALKTQDSVLTTQHSLPPLKPGQSVGSDRAQSAAPDPSTRDLPLIWETGHPYFYLRPDTATRRLIIGGEDDDFVDPETRDARLPQKTRTLANKLAKLRPDLNAEVDCAWAGTFAETPDALPYIGPHPEFPRGLFALGYGGNGITFALIAARLLRDRILNRPNPDADLFRFDR
jgi:glycine/D-amino acid oxidase-like deaminating enzyme